MRSKFLLCGVLAAMCALVLPATSGAASFSPAGHQFEIQGAGALSTSLGYCGISKITGTATKGAPATLTVGTCSSGTSASFTGNWSMTTSGMTYGVVFGGGSLTMRFTSLPGCQLTSSNPYLFGMWMNSINYGFKSYYHGDSAVTLTWQNDGGTCAMAGQQELVTYKDGSLGGQIRTPAFHPVIDLTSAGTIYYDVTN